MVKPAQLPKQSLESLRMESECLQMARRSANPDMQAHFIRMARNWNRISVMMLEEPAAAEWSLAAVWTI